MISINRNAKEVARIDAELKEVLAMLRVMKGIERRNHILLGTQDEYEGPERRQANPES